VLSVVCVSVCVYVCVCVCVCLGWVGGCLHLGGKMHRKKDLPFADPCGYWVLGVSSGQVTYQGTTALREDPPPPVAPGWTRDNRLDAGPDPGANSVQSRALCPAQDTLVHHRGLVGAQ
jgi:hypothetical protein